MTRAKPAPKSRPSRKKGADGLTERQREMLKFIMASIRLRQRPPLLQEICEHFGFASSNGPVRVLQVLEKKGKIKLLKRRSAGIYLCNAKITIKLRPKNSAGREKC